MKVSSPASGRRRIGIATLLVASLRRTGFFRLSVRRRVIIVSCSVVAIAMLTAIWRQPALCRVGTLLSLLAKTVPSRLSVPVEKVEAKNLVDTWGAPRSGNRRHEGIDIFAPQGTPVISTTEGVVFKVGEDNLGGHVAVVLGPGWVWHYYAHLDSFADIKPGTVVQKGTVLGYVGNTGNAVGTPYHLHYGVYRFMGGAQNPYPLLADRTDRKIVTAQARKVSKRQAKELTRRKTHKPAVTLSRKV